MREINKIRDIIQTGKNRKCVTIIKCGYINRHFTMLYGDGLFNVGYLVIGKML